MTIIVLLILAGISIAMLTGENGILNKGTIAKEENEEESANEKIKQSITASIEQNGSLNVEDFKKEIINMGGKIIEEKEITITVKIDKYEAIINIKDKKIEDFYEINEPISKIEEIPE